LIRIQDAVKTHQSNLPDNAKVYKVYKYQEASNAFYRIVYQLPNGFSEILAEFAKTDNTISLQSYQAYLV